MPGQAYTMTFALNSLKSIQNTQDTMQIAGKFLSLAQGAAEGALLSSLRSKYRLNLNLETLASRAKEDLMELNIPITPKSLLTMADELASRESTMLGDVVGLEQSRWNPKLQDYEEYIVPDPREYFIR